MQIFCDVSYGYLTRGQPIIAALAALAFMVFIKASAPPACEPLAESLNMSVATRADPLRLSQMRSGAVTRFGCIEPIMFSLNSPHHPTMTMHRYPSKPQRNSTHHMIPSVNTQGGWKSWMSTGKHHGGCGYG